MTQTLLEMQHDVDNYVQQFKVGYFTPLAQLARLTEEVGELAREINHNYGPKQKKSSEKPKSVEEELSDILFVTLALANSLDIDLTPAFNTNMEKLKTRDQFRFERTDDTTRTGEATDEN